MVGWYDGYYGGSTEDSLLDASLESNDRDPLCVVDSVFDGTKYGMFKEWILWVLIWFTDGIGLGSDVSFLLLYTDGRVICFTAEFSCGLMKELY